MMKAIVILLTMLLLLLVVCGAFAQAVPDSITYQGKLTDTLGQPVPDGPYQVQFSLYDVETGGSPFWTSPAQNVTTSGGLFTTRLEDGSPTSLCPALLSGKTDVWLEVLVGSPLAPLSPRVKLASAPFAFRSDDLTLPFLGTVSSGSTAFSVANTGTGGAVKAGTNVSSTFPAVYAQDLGSGGAVFALTAGSGVAVEAYVNGTGRAGKFVVYNASNTTDALYASTSGSGSAVYADATGSGKGVYAASAGSGAAVEGYATGTGRAGQFSISNAGNPFSALYADTIGSGNAIYAMSNSSGDVIESFTTGTGRAGRFAIQNARSTSDVLYALNTGEGNAVYGYTTGTGRAGYFRINNSLSPSNAVRVETNTAASALNVTNLASGNFGQMASFAIGVYGSAASNGGKGVFGNADGDNSYGLYGYSAAATGGVGVYAHGGPQGYAAVLRGNVQIQDRTTGAAVMELGTGLDYAEGFDVSDETGIEPGTVLVIDPANPGKLTVSTKAYDRRVAGIVAGANGVSSGVRLGVDQFDCDVALAGRVYCSVDATEAGVEPGDLLTTSGTPGYAMKVTRWQNAHGAILGKAMQALPKGTKGQMLVLVTLQ